MLYLRHMSLASSLSFKEVHVYLLLCKWVLSCPNHLLILHGFPNDLWEIEVRLILIFFWLWQILLAVRDLSYPSKVLEAAWQWLSSRMPPCVFCLFVSNSVKYFLYGHTVSLSLMSAFFFFFFQDRMNDVCDLKRMPSKLDSLSWVTSRDSRESKFCSPKESIIRAFLPAY